VPGSLLAVHAHPDDEVLYTGALIAQAAAAGLPVTVVTCTRGERGEVLALPGTASARLAHLEGDGPALAAYREQELAASLRALGDTVRGTFLDKLPCPVVSTRPPASAYSTTRVETKERYEDSGMIWIAPGIAGPDPSVTGGFCAVPLDEAAARLALLIRREHPAVVATYDETGGYGHPDHIRAHQVTVRAMELAADPTFASDGLAPWAADLWQRTPLGAQIDVGASDIAQIEVAPVLDRVLAAMLAHATQIQNVSAVAAGEALGSYALSNGVPAGICAQEFFLVTQTETGSQKFLAALDRIER